MPYNPVNEITSHSIAETGKHLPDMLDYKTGADWSGIVTAENNLTKAMVLKYGNPDNWATRLHEMRHGEGNFVDVLSKSNPDLAEQALEFANLQLSQAIVEHRRQNPLIDLAYRIGEKIASGQDHLKAWQDQLFGWTKDKLK